MYVGIICTLCLNQGFYWDHTEECVDNWPILVDDTWDPEVDCICEMEMVPCTLPFGHAVMCTKCSNGEVWTGEGVAFCGFCDGLGWIYNAEIQVHS